MGASSGVGDLAAPPRSGFQSAFPACAEVLGELLRWEDPPVASEAGKQRLGRRPVCAAEAKRKGRSAAVQTQGIRTPASRRAEKNKERRREMRQRGFVGVWNACCGRRGWKGGRCRRGEAVASWKTLGVTESASKSYGCVL